MTIITKSFQFGGKNRPFGTIGPLLGMLIMGLIIFFLIKGLYALFAKIGIIVLIITLILDYNVVLDFAKDLLLKIKNNPLGGLFSVLMTIVFSPFVCIYLLAKAIMRRAVKKHINEIKKERDRFDTYEEVAEDEEDFLELPSMPKATPKPQPTVTNTKKNNQYEDLFE